LSEVDWVFGHPPGERHLVAWLDPEARFAGAGQLDPSPVPHAGPDPEALVGGDLLHTHPRACTVVSAYRESGGLPVNDRIARPSDVSVRSPVVAAGATVVGAGVIGFTTVGSGARSWVARSAPTTSDPVPASAWPGWSWSQPRRTSTGLTRASGRKPASARRRSVRDRSRPRTPCTRADALRHRGRTDGGDPPADKALRTDWQRSVGRSMARMARS